MNTTQHLRERLEDPSISPEYKSIIEGAIKSRKTFGGFFVGERVHRVTRNGNTLRYQIHEVVDPSDPDFRREFERQHGDTWTVYVGGSSNYVGIRCIWARADQQTNVGDTRANPLTRLVRAAS